MASVRRNAYRLRPGLGGLVVLSPALGAHRATVFGAGHRATLLADRARRAGAVATPAAIFLNGLVKETV